jgi:hypothetical protein
VLLLSGEAGIGKSRLAAEGKRQASEQGLLVLQGNCFPPMVAQTMVRQLISPANTSIWSVR